ncbi:MAG: hypothetical protein L3K08_07450, partial [Thermoplasmata archaeon]|nr:hypothetical protein [Thermoplasmata archaeon]
MAFDAADGYVVLVDGGNNTVANASNFNLADTWTYLHGSWTNLNISGPRARGLMSMTYDPKDGYVVLFGGSPGWWGVGNDFNDTWTFSAGHWTDLNLSHAPTPRRSAAMAYDAQDGYVVLFGGLKMASSQYSDLSDTWKFVGGHWTDLAPKLNLSPVGRDGAQMAYDPGFSATVLFGG